MVKKGNMHYIHFSLNVTGYYFLGGTLQRGKCTCGLFVFCWVLDEKMNSAVMALHYAQSWSLSGRLRTAGND